MNASIFSRSGAWQRYALSRVLFSASTASSRAAMVRCIGSTTTAVGMIALYSKSIKARSFSSAAAAASASAPVSSRPVIYQYQTCPFCNRVKSYLDYLGVEYDVVEVNPLTKAEIKFAPDYNKVPLAVIGGKVIGDSGAIIDEISATYLRASEQNRRDFLSADSSKWMEWSEKQLAVKLYPNITRSVAESWECFGYSKNVSTWSLPERISVRVLGTVAMYFANGKIKKKYGITDERKALAEEIAVWCDALGDKPFVHGNTVSLPDLMVFGVLRSIAGLQTFREIMAENEKLSAWYDRVALEAHSMESKVKLDT